MLRQIFFGSRAHCVSSAMSIMPFSFYWTNLYFSQSVLALSWMDRHKVDLDDIWYFLSQTANEVTGKS